MDNSPNGQPPQVPGGSRIAPFLPDEADESVSAEQPAQPVPDSASAQTQSMPVAHPSPGLPTASAASVHGGTPAPADGLPQPAGQAMRNVFASPTQTSAQTNVPQQPVPSPAQPAQQPVQAAPQPAQQMPQQPQAAPQPAQQAPQQPDLPASSGTTGQFPGGPHISVAQPAAQFPEPNRQPGAASPTAGENPGHNAPIASPAAGAPGSEQAPAPARIIPVVGHESGHAPTAPQGHAAPPAPQAHAASPAPVAPSQPAAPPAPATPAAPQAHAAPPAVPGAQAIPPGVASPEGSPQSNGSAPQIAPQTSAPTAPYQPASPPAAGVAPSSPHAPQPVQEPPHTVHLSAAEAAANAAPGNVVDPASATPAPQSWPHPAEGGVQPAVGEPTEGAPPGQEPGRAGANPAEEGANPEENTAHTPQEWVHSMSTETPLSSPSITPAPKKKRGLFKRNNASTKQPSAADAGAPGDADTVEDSQVEGIQHLINEQSIDAGGLPAPRSPYSQPEPDEVVSPNGLPANHMKLAAWSLVVGGWIFGLPAVLAAAKVHPLHLTGEWASAQDAAKRAKTYATISFLCACFVILMVIAAVAMPYIVNVLRSS